MFIIETIIGVYLGGSFVVTFFWLQGGEDLSEEEKSFYKIMMVAWPIYIVAIMLYKILKYFKGDMNG